MNEKKDKSLEDKEIGMYKYGVDDKQVSANALGKGVKGLSSVKEMKPFVYTKAKKNEKSKKGM